MYEQSRCRRPALPPPSPAGKPRCSVHGALEHNRWMPVTMAAGALLFWFAAALSTSTSFRVGTGTSIFVVSALGLLLVMMVR